MTTSSYLRRLTCFGMASLIALQPAVIASSYANPPRDGEKEAMAEVKNTVEMLDEVLKTQSKHFKYLDKEGKEVDYVRAITSKEKFFMVPTGDQEKFYRKGRIIGLASKVESGKIVMNMSVYDVAKGFAKKTFVSGGKVVIGGEGAQATVDDVRTQVGVISSEILASQAAAPGDRKLASGSCLMTTILNTIVTASSVAALAAIGAIAYGILSKPGQGKGFVLYGGYTLFISAGVFGVFGTIKRIIGSSINCDQGI